MPNKHQPKDNYTVGRTLSTGVVSPRQTPPHPSTLAVPDTSSKPKRRAWKKALAFTILLILLVPLIIGIWDAYNYSRASQKLFGSGNLLSALTPTTLKGSDRGRVNILIVGFSADDPGHAGAKLTDSIMVVSLNPDSRTGYMLSIPRDLYVLIPAFGRAKINEAYQDGEAGNFSEVGYAPGGMGLLEKTISQSLGIQTDYYALVNYTAVRDITDALDGITVNIQSSDARGIYDPNFKANEGGPLRLSNGPQDINGLTALRLTRARGAAGGSYGLALSDFDRTKNQQAVLTGIKNKISWGILLNPIKNDPLLAAAGDNIRTDISISEVLPLFRLFHSVPESALKTVTLRDINGQNLLIGYTTPYGQSALIPAAGPYDYSDIRVAIQGLN
ncbi:MAG TPA: LCP family protein [Candidatus Limnocylindrales bacterium]|nr:LCP family protein [Candidatus Limnocylindrales bacterium]